MIYCSRSKKQTKNENKKMPTQTKPAKKTDNSFFATINRVRSLNKLEELSHLVKIGATNPKTIRRRKAAIEEKYVKLAKKTVIVS